MENEMFRVEKWEFVKGIINRWKVIESAIKGCFKGREMPKPTTKISCETQWNRRKQAKKRKKKHR